MRGELTYGRDVFMMLVVFSRAGSRLGDAVEVGPYCVLKMSRSAPARRSPPSVTSMMRVIGPDAVVGPFAACVRVPNLDPRCISAILSRSRRAELPAPEGQSPGLYRRRRNRRERVNVSAGTIVYYDGANKVQDGHRDDVFIGSDTACRAGDGWTQGNAGGRNDVDQGRPPTP